MQLAYNCKFQSLKKQEWGKNSGTTEENAIRTIHFLALLFPWWCHTKIQQVLPYYQSNSQYLQSSRAQELWAQFPAPSQVHWGLGHICECM